MADEHKAKEVRVWQVDRNVSLAVILAAGFYGISIVIWAANTNSQVVGMSISMSEIKESIKELQKNGSNMNLLEYRLDQIDSKIGRIESGLEGDRQ